MLLAKLARTTITEYILQVWQDGQPVQVSEGHSTCSVMTSCLSLVCTGVDWEQ